MAKPSLIAYANEDKPMEIAPKTPVTAPAAVEVKKSAIGRGRPKTKPESKLTSFHLPLELISKIDADALATAGGNKSLFLIRVLEEYFKKKQG